MMFIILFVRYVFEWMSGHGFPVDIVSFEEWRKR